MPAGLLTGSLFTTFIGQTLYFAASHWSRVTLEKPPVEGIKLYPSQRSRCTPLSWRMLDPVSATGHEGLSKEPTQSQQV